MSARMMVEEAKSRSGVVPSPSVLVVDDDDETRLLVMTALAMGQVRCTQASSGEEALELANAHPEGIDVIVLDVVLPGIDGFEVLRRLKASPITASIPVIIVSGSATQDRDVVSATEIGASDHLAKPCSPTVLLAKVRSLRTRTRAERTMREELHFASLHAMTDALTGLFNRRNFDARMRELSAHAIRQQEPFAVVMLDLDHFKDINDAHGHAEGDRVLVHFADAIRSVMRVADVAFRYGGDELVLLLRNCDAARAVDVANRLRERLRATPVRFADGTEVAIAFSAGTAAAEASESFVGANLVSRADSALYRAKAEGRDRVVRW